MKTHSINKEFNEELDLMAHGRGKRQLLPTRVMGKDIRNRRAQLHLQDGIEDDLDELGLHGIKIG